MLLSTKQAQALVAKTLLAAARQERFNPLLLLLVLLLVLLLLLLLLGQGVTRTLTLSPASVHIVATPARPGQRAARA